MGQFFASGGQSIGVSASASVFPMNIQDLFPLGWTGLISSQCKGLSRVFSNTTVQKQPVCLLRQFISECYTTAHSQALKGVPLPATGRLQGPRRKEPEARLSSWQPPDSYTARTRGFVGEVSSSAFDIRKSQILGFFSQQIFWLTTFETNMGLAQSGCA